MLTPLALLLAVALLLGRGLVWIVNLLVVLPLFDPLRKLPGPTGPFFFSHIQRVVEYVDTLICFGNWAVNYRSITVLISAPHNTKSGKSSMEKLSDIMDPERYTFEAISLSDLQWTCNFASV